VHCAHDKIAERLFAAEPKFAPSGLRRSGVDPVINHPEEVVVSDFLRIEAKASERRLNVNLKATIVLLNGLGLGCLAMRLLGLLPQTVADNLRNWRPLPGLPDNFDATIEDNSLGSL
jgi:hypothetical protein